ncbi:MAG: cytochrome-c oxidase [Acidobacteria bacterium]|nr:cytochrome-c oxidase [Acidobacteriota bacterium]
MAPKTSERPNHPFQGRLLAVGLAFVTLASSWLFVQRRWWLPELASLHGIDIDRVFLVTLAITGVFFILLQGVLAYFSFRYGENGRDRARYWIRPALEKRFALIAGIIIFGVDVTIFALGESNWFRAWGPSPEGTPVVEVMGEQFAWNFRYPGPDGAFGKTEARLISSTNPFGVDKTDPAAVDDILSVNQLHLPEDKPVRLRIRSHDVIHSFFLPHQRVKQDAVPGMQIELWFVPRRAGQFEIACSQLCGLGHYRMRAFLTVEPREAFDKWLADIPQGGN